MALDADDLVRVPAGEESRRLGVVKDGHPEAGPLERVDGPLLTVEDHLATQTVRDPQDGLKQCHTLELPRNALAGLSNVTATMTVVPARLTRRRRLHKGS